MLVVTINILGTETYTCAEIEEHEKKIDHFPLEVKRNVFISCLTFLETFLEFFFLKKGYRIEATYAWKYKEAGQQQSFVT